MSSVSVTSVNTQSADEPSADTPPGAAEVFGEALPLAERYAALLTGPGVERGLIGPGEAGRIWDRHLLNCAAVAELVPDGSTVADLGSGAGLPGIVLAILRPAAEVILVEPMARRVTFLDECVSALGLANARVVRGRAEDLAGEISADIVTARAVAPLDRLAGWALGLCRPGGTILAIKGASASAEVAAAGPALRRLGLADVAVLQVGSDRLGEAATVVRLVAPRRPGGSQSRRNSRSRGGARSAAKRRSSGARSGRPSQAGPGDS
jgi:16S rRNA (guanine527-N7)-methyltransferase